MKPPHQLDAPASASPLFIEHGPFEKLGSETIPAENSSFLSAIFRVYHNNHPMRGSVKTKYGTHYILNIIPLPSHHGHPLSGVVITFENHQPECERLQPSQLAGLNVQENEVKSHAANAIRLTPRECQVLNLILNGKPNKIIAAELKVSQRTVENHRASIMRKTGAKSLSGLFRIAYLTNYLSNKPEPSFL